MTAAHICTRQSMEISGRLYHDPRMASSQKWDGTSRPWETCYVIRFTPIGLSTRPVQGTSIYGFRSDIVSWLEIESIASLRQRDLPLEMVSRPYQTPSVGRKFVNRRYMLSTGLNIKSLIKFFHVGEDDIRIVYDVTANKLNDCVWVPSFWLPTVDSLLRVVNET